jgi:hypothetical protein
MNVPSDSASMKNRMCRWLCPGDSPGNSSFSVLILFIAISTVLFGGHSMEISPAEIKVVLPGLALENGAGTPRGQACGAAIPGCAGSASILLAVGTGGWRQDAARTSTQDACAIPTSLIAHPQAVGRHSSDCSFRRARGHAVQTSQNIEPAPAGRYAGPDACVPPSFPDQSLLKSAPTGLAQDFALSFFKSSARNAATSLNFATLAGLRSIRM